MHCGPTTLSVKFLGSLLAARVAETFGVQSHWCQQSLVLHLCLSMTDCYQHQTCSEARFCLLSQRKWPLSLVLWLTGSHRDSVPTQNPFTIFFFCLDMRELVFLVGFYGLWSNHNTRNGILWKTDPNMWNQLSGAVGALLFWLDDSRFVVVKHLF